MGVAIPPWVLIPSVCLQNGFPLINLLCLTDFISTLADARRVIQQGAVRINGKVVDDPEMLLTEELFCDGAVEFKIGKKLAMMCSGS